MIGKRLTKFAQENSMTAKENYAYGYYNGYLTTITRSGTHISVSFAVKIYDTPHSRKYSELLCDHKNKVLWSVSDIVFTETYMEIIFVDTNNTIEKIKTCIDTVTDMMKNDGITNNKVCTICGEAANDEASGIYFYEGRAHIIDHSCVEKVNKKYSDLKRRNKGIRNRILIKLGRKREIAVPRKIVRLK